MPKKRESVSPPTILGIYERPHGTLSEFTTYYTTTETLCHVKTVRGLFTQRPQSGTPRHLNGVSTVLSSLHTSRGEFNSLLAPHDSHPIPIVFTSHGESLLTAFTGFTLYIHQGHSCPIPIIPYTTTWYRVCQVVSLGPHRPM